MQAAEEIEVFQRGQVGLERGQVAQVGDRPRAQRGASPARPSMATSPASARSRPASTRSSVVLPAPLSPCTSSASPGVDGEIERAEHRLFVAREGEAACGEQRRMVWWESGMAGRAADAKVRAFYRQHSIAPQPAQSTHNMSAASSGSA